MVKRDKQARDVRILQQGRRYGDRLVEARQLSLSSE